MVLSKFYIRVLDQKWVKQKDTTRLEAPAGFLKLPPSNVDADQFDLILQRSLKSSGNSEDDLRKQKKQEVI